ncbi:MAG: phage BR0599 family protein [Candidatus Reddybacter sp.]
MAFNDKHKSLYLGEPVFLYDITMGSVTHRHTAAELPITVGATTWATHPGIIHSDVSDAGDQAAKEVTIALGATHPVAVYLSAYIPTIEITVKIYLLERGDVAEEMPLYWSGTFTRYRQHAPSFDLICEPADYEHGKEAMAPNYGPDCQWSQYDPNCQLAPGAFVEAGAVLSVSDLTINTDASLTAVAADHFQGGYIEITGDYGLERAWILSQSGNSVGIDRVLPAMVGGVAINCYPSCRGDFARCNTIFTNRLRFVGAPHANMVNPFRGEGVKATERN